MNQLIGNCRKCGYSLVRLTVPRCPECGTEFNPDDPRTMVIHHWPLASFLARPMTWWGWLPAVAACAGAYVAKAAIRDPIGGAYVIFAAMMICGVTLYVWLAKRNFRRWLKRRQQEAEKQQAAGEAEES